MTQRRWIGILALLAACGAEEQIGEVAMQTAEVTTPPIPDQMMRYNFGPVMVAPNVYIIWYGNWGTNTALSLVPDFIRHLSGSSWWDINTTYTTGTGVPLPNAITYKAATFDGYSQGTNITDPTRIVSGVLDRGNLPLDAKGIYLVLSSVDVSFGGLCQSICGYHSSFSYGSTDVKYAVTGDLSQCGGCGGQRPSSPNGNVGFDAMINVIAHELTEATTDPIVGTGWIGATGLENADLCAWNFPEIFTTSNGSPANLILPNGRSYLVQSNWVHSQFPEAHCAMRKTGVNALVVFTTNASVTATQATYQGPQTCGANRRCALFYFAGTQVTLTATANPGCTLEAIGGCDSTAGATCSITLREPSQQVTVGASCGPPPDCFQSCLAECLSEGTPRGICNRTCRAACGS